MWKIPAIGFVLGAAFAAIGYAACGASLGLIVAGFFGATLLAVPLGLVDRSLIPRVLASGAVVDGIALVWLLASFSSFMSLGQWLACYILLISYSAALIGVSSTLNWAGISSMAANAITVVLALIWLTWPVWASPHLTGTGGEALVARLISIHPLFAANGVLVEWGDWSHWPLAYRQLTTFGQDIPFALPKTVWPAALAHLLIGVILFSARFAFARKKWTAATETA